MLARCLFIALLVLFLGPRSLLAADQSTPRTILVLDASGSMWGQIDGKSKIEIARKSMGSLVSGWNPNIHLGLIAYGHRRKGDCQDIETVLPVGPVNAKTFSAKVNGLMPKGKTPLGAAVRMAAEQLKFTEAKATVILVSDGLETCNVDPCKLSGELEAKGIDFTVHVIGFDIKKEEQAQLQCIADNTGGMFILAKNASGLHDALEAVEKVVEQKVVVAEPKPKPQPVVEPGVRLVAVLSDKGPEVEKDLGWRITEPKPNQDGSYKSITYTSNAKPVLKLASGTYRVHVKTGDASAETIIEVDASKAVEHRLNLNAGYLKLAAFLKEGGSRVDKGLSWRITEPKANFEGAYKNVSYQSSAVPLFILPQGTYRVLVKTGDASAVTQVEVKAAEATEQAVILNAGYLKMAAFLKEGGSRVDKGLVWRITEPKANLEGAYKNVSYQSSAVPLFILPQGTYRVLVKTGDASAVTQVDVKADEITEQAVPLNAGYLKLAAFNKEGGKRYGSGLGWRITEPKPNLDGTYKNVSYQSSAVPLFILPEGSYRVYVKIGNASTAVQVEVKADEATEQPVFLNAGSVKLVAEDAKSGQQMTSGLGWWVKEPKADLEGKRKDVAYSSSATPIFTLPEGTYYLFVKSGTIQTETEFQVQAGDEKEIKVLVGSK